MSRVLFINVGSEGHINPTLGVVQELIRCGEEVIYFTGDHMRERVESTGARVITCDSEKLLQVFLDGGAEAAGLLRTADLVIPSLLEQIKGEHFDYIIHDSMFGCGRLIAQILDLPAINSCTSFAFLEESFDSLQDHRSRQLSADANERARKELRHLVDSVEAKYDVRVGSLYEVYCNPAPPPLSTPRDTFSPMETASTNPTSLLDRQYSRGHTTNLIFLL